MTEEQEFGWYGIGAITSLLIGITVSVLSDTPLGMFIPIGYIVLLALFDFIRMASTKEGR